MIEKFSRYTYLSSCPVFYLQEKVDGFGESNNYTVVSKSVICVKILPYMLSPVTPDVYTFKCELFTLFCVAFKGKSMFADKGEGDRSNCVETA